MKFAQHLPCQTPPAAAFYTKKIVYTIYKDCMTIKTYQQNSQLTFTSSKLTQEIVEQEAKYVESQKERHQSDVN